MKKVQGRNPSPCLTCTRVPNPRNCENKQCRLWQRWFLARWNLIHTWPRTTDPCKGCLCPRDLCATPCRRKVTWLEAKEERL